jgi:hypothetical protein
VDTADADADCTASSCPDLVACLALPADDDRSSCRLGRLYFQTDRVLDRIGATRCRWNRGRRRVYFGSGDGQRIED